MADMTGDQLDRVLTKLGMTQSGAARYFDITSRTMRKYIAGDAPIPVPMILALTALRTGIDPHKLRRRAGLDPVDFAQPVGRSRALAIFMLAMIVLGCASTAMAESTALNNKRMDYLDAANIGMPGELVRMLDENPDIVRRNTISRVGTDTPMLDTVNDQKRGDRAH